jgi:hypothetical protein
MGQGAEENGTVAEVDAVEYADGQIHRAGEGGEVRDGVEDDGHWRGGRLLEHERELEHELLEKIEELGARLRRGVQVNVKE